MSTLTALLILPTLGVTELLVILLIVVVIFGAKKLPMLGKGLGEGIKNFKKGIKSSNEPTSLEDSPGTEEEKAS